MSTISEYLYTRVYTYFCMYIINIFLSILNGQEEMLKKACLKTRIPGKNLNDALTRPL